MINTSTKSSSITKLDIEDPTTFNHQNVSLDCGVNYHYVDEGPVDGPVIMLLHGFPELWYVWKYQIQHFSILGFRVIVPDMIGYGQTTLNSDIDKLESFTLEFNCYALKSLIFDHVLKSREFEKIVVIGHDWGAATTWHFANLFPQHISSLVGLSYSYFKRTRFVDVENVVDFDPVFGYQLAMIKSKIDELDLNLEKVLQFYWNMDIKSLGINNFNKRLEIPKSFDLLQFINTLNYTIYEQFPGTKFMDYMVAEYNRQGLKGPINWYKTSKLNFDDALKFKNNYIDIPTLTMIGKDDFSYKWINSGNKYFKDLKLEGLTGAGHWLQLSHYEEVNRSITEFLKSKLQEQFPNLASKL